MFFTEAFKIKDAVKEKYKTATQEERLYFNSYLAATSEGSIVFGVGIFLCAAFAGMCFVLSYLFMTHPYNLISVVFLLCGLIFLVSEAICLVAVINGDVNRFIKILENK